MSQAAVRYLMDTQDPSGGWGYTPTGTPGVEPTALAVLALRGAAEAASEARRAQDWLASIQNKDGGWGMNGLDPRSGWHTAWGVLALKGEDKYSESIRRGQEWLAAVEVYREQNVDVLKAFNQALKVDFALAAWSWGPNEASWVQPTALAMLALRNDPPIVAAQARLDEAVRFLDNRRVPGGGWNVGNPAMFDGVLPAHTIPTALGLLALASYAPDLIQPGDLTVLREKAAEDSDAKALGWALLGLRTMSEETSELSEDLLAEQLDDGSWESSPYSTAISLLGLEGVL